MVHRGYIATSLSLGCRLHQNNFAFVADNHTFFKLLIHESSFVRSTGLVQPVSVPFAVEAPLKHNQRSQALGVGVFGQNVMVVKR